MQKVTDKDKNDSAPEFQVVPPSLIEWDKSQREVIDAPLEDRILVGAGPGTGKTAVACARVSQLIDQGGLEPSRIWLISFSRNARFARLDDPFGLRRRSENTRLLRREY